ncbi:hypothetical protein JNE17039_45270 (plasmid) [Escherichia coli]
MCGEGQRQLCVKALDECSTEHPVFYEDEVDIHLNPKIGADWQLLGQQKRGGARRDRMKKYYLTGAAAQRDR